MIENPFCAKSAALYDAVYADRNWSGIADLYSQHLAPRLKYPDPDAVYIPEAGKPAYRLWDHGCGTGRMILEMRARGWDPSGCDPSQHMIAIARSKGCWVVRGSIGSLKYCELYPHQAIMAAYTVIGYAALDLDGLSKLFLGFRRVLPLGGRLAFDFIQTACAEQHLRMSRLHYGDGWRRHDLRQYDRPLLTVEMQWSTHGECPLYRQLDAWTETHILRTFSLQEIVESLHSAGFGNITFCPLEEPEAEITDDTWHVFTACTAT